MKIDRNELLLFGMQGLLVAAILTAGLDLFHWRWAVPLCAEGDALHYLAVARSVLDDGSPWNIARLSAPFGLPMVMFPFFGISELTLFKFFALFCTEPGTLINCTYFTSFLLTALSACWCLRVLRFSRISASVVGLLFAFLPSAFLRNTAHLMLVYYAVPFIATTAILICSNSISSLPRYTRFFLLAGTVLVGFNYIYTAFFGCFVLGLAGLYNLLNTRRFAGVSQAGILIFAICSVSLINVLPSAMAWRHDPAGKANLIGTKGFAEADTFGLKLRHLLTPRPGHPVQVLANVADQTLGKYPLDNENTAARLGLIGSIGFLYLLAVSLFMRRSASAGSEGFALDGLAALSLGSFLLATVGGLGSIFNFFVSPEIRCYNRISVYIAFFSLTAFAHLWRRVGAGRSFATHILIGVVLLTLGITDEAGFDYLNARHAASAARFDATRRFVQELEQQLPPGAKIYQLPNSPYPNTPTIVNMECHTHLLAYVVSRNLQWSWPALSGAAMTFNSNLSKLAAPELVSNLETFGFSGIWINCTGYDVRGNALIQELESITGERHLKSPDGEYVFIRLPPTAANEQASVSSSKNYEALLTQMANASFGSGIDFSAQGRSSLYIESGWADQEESFRWTDGQQSELRFVFSRPAVSDIKLTVDAFAFLTGTHNSLFVDVLANGVPVARWKYQAEGSKASPFTCRIPHEIVKDSTSLRLTLRVDQPVSPYTLGVSEDHRTLGIAVRELRFDQEP